MQRRAFLLALALSPLAGMARAQDATAEIVRVLQSRGYGAITVSRTLLGRVRILAERDGATREIILNPATGEILRDLVKGGSGSGGDLLDQQGSSGKGGDDGDDDDDDDDDDD